MKNRNKSGDEPSFMFAEEEPVNKLSYDHHSSGSGYESETSIGNGYESETSTSSSSSTSCSDDDDEFHGFVKEKSIFQRQRDPFKGTYNVTAFFLVTDTKPKKRTNNNNYFNNSLQIAFPQQNDRSTAVSILGDRKEEEKWRTMSSDFPLFLEQVIFNGDSVDLQQNATKNFYKATDAWGGVGQYLSKNGKLIVGRNTVQGAANELYCGGIINQEMYDDLINDTDLNGKFIVYFIDVIHRQIAFFYRNIGCPWTKMAPGLVAGKLVKGYDSIRRKYKKRKRDRSDTDGGESSRPSDKRSNMGGESSRPSDKRSNMGGGRGSRPSDKRPPSGTGGGRVFRPSDKRPPSGTGDGRVFRPSDKRPPSGTGDGRVFRPSDKRPPSGTGDGRVFRPSDKRPPSGTGRGRGSHSSDKRPPSGTGRGRGSHSSGKRSRSGRDPSAVDGGIVREKIKPVITMNDVSSSGKRSRSGRDAAAVDGGIVDFNFVQAAALAAASAVTATESSRSHPIDTENRRMIALPRDNDVLFGRGRQQRRHHGNLRYHRYINRYRQEYVEARWGEKAGIARHVIHAVKQPERVHTKVLPGGRFLKKVVHTTKVHHNPNQVYWEEVTTDIALEKICHALREREHTRWGIAVDTPSDEDINAAVHDATAAVEVVVHDTDASSQYRPSGSRPRPGTGGHGSRSSGPQSRSNTLKENAGNNGGGNSLSIGLATSKKRKPSQAYVRKPSIDMKKKKTNSRTAAATVVSSSSWEYNPEAYVCHASDTDKYLYNPEANVFHASDTDKQSYNPEESAYDASGMETDYNFAELRAKLSDSTQDF